VNSNSNINGIAHNFQLLEFLDDCRNRTTIFTPFPTDFESVVTTASTTQNFNQTFNNIVNTNISGNLCTAILPVESAYDQNNNTNGLLVKEGNTMHVVFRGTADLTDALSDAYISLIQFVFNQTDKNPTCTHSGFTYSVASKMDYLLYHEQEIVDSDKIIITGHSLGGAMSFVYAYYLATK